RVATIEWIAKADGAVAMQHLRIRTRTTFSVPGACVIGLIVSLRSHTIDDDVIYFHIAIISIVRKCNTQFTGSVSADGVVEHTYAQRPGLNSLATNLQADTFVSGDTAHAHRDTVATTGNRAA